MELGLAGKLALITGGAGGIGFGCAKALAAEGVNVMIADINETQARQKAAELEQLYDVRTWALRIDVTDVHSIREAWRVIKEEAGTVDILVNNAGGRINRGSIETLSDEEWMRTFDLTTHSGFLMSKEFVHQYDKACFGAVINLTSKSAIMSSSRGNAHYAAAKAAVIGMTRAMAKDLYDKNIRVNCVAPGYVKTEKTYPDDDPRTAEKKRLLLTHAFASPDDIGSVVAFLCSDQAAKQMIGCVVDVTGGTLI